MWGFTQIAGIAKAETSARGSELRAHTHIRWARSLCNDSRQGSMGGTSIHLVFCFTRMTS